MERGRNMTRCYLLDLERTIGLGEPHYWKGNRHGYTTDIKQAGKWKKEFCESIIERDFYKDTILITEETIERIFGKGSIQHERIPNRL
jgi:hypothetical protein